MDKFSGQATIYIMSTKTWYKQNKYKVYRQTKSKRDNAITSTGGYKITRKGSPECSDTDRKQGLIGSSSQFRILAIPGKTMAGSSYGVHEDRDEV